MLLWAALLLLIVTPYVTPQSNGGRLRCSTTPKGCWDLYRLGDVVKHHGVPKKWQPPPNSIAAEYLRRTKLENDFGTLAAIVRERLRDRRFSVRSPPPDTAIVHLRLGDTADLHEPSELWEKGSPIKRMTNNASGVILEDYDEQFVKPRSYYVAVIDAMPLSVHRIIVVSFALHHHHLTKFDHAHKSSIAYRELVVSLFRNNRRDFTVETRNGERRRAHCSRE